MSDGTQIGWTQATWNPTTGCDKVSDGCTNCYALTLAGRLKAMGSAKYQTDGDPRTSGPGFGLAVHPDTLSVPLRWRKPRRIFVNSMSDLFHARVPREFVARVFAVMAATPQHTYQILTKRPDRMARMLSSEEFEVAVGAVLVRDYADLPGGSPWTLTRRIESGFARPEHWPLPNVWLGTSVEDQERADQRLPALCETPAAVRWVSAEPLLAPVDLSPWLGPVDWPPCWDQHEPSAECSRCIQPEWMVLGGESGPGARPMQVEWAESLVAQCQAAGVAVFVKQLGTVLGGKSHHDMATFPSSLRVREYPDGAR